MRKSNNEIFCIFGAIIFLFACFNSNSAAAMNPLAHSTTKSQLKNTNNVATLPKYDTLSTGTISLAVGVDGSFGGEGDAGASGVYMDYFFFSPECDTTVSIPGDTRLYLYDGSVFVGGIVGGDTVVSNVIFHGPLDTCPTCFYQMTNETHPTTDDVIQFYNTGVFRNNDSTIGLQLTYYAPQFTVNFDFGPGKIWKADEQFITKELKVWSLNGMTRENITVGEVIDWDIPSDWWYDNTGEVDESRNLLYGAGAEYNQDDSVECQDNSLRFGGIAFGYFKRFVAHPDTIAWFIVDSVPYGGYHESNRRYFYGNSWNDNELYFNIERYSGLNPWSHSHPDSQAVDLHSVLTYVFEYDLMPGDTLVFYSVMATVRNANDETPKSTSARIKELADKGRNFVRYFGCCHNLRGDLNTDGKDVDIVDLTFLVSQIFRGGPSPTCAGEGDVNADGSPSNILDLSFIVDRIFRGGRAPYSCGEAPCNIFGCHNN